MSLPNKILVKVCTAVINMVLINPWVLNHKFVDISADMHQEKP